MKVVYYPDMDETSGHNRVKEFVEKELYKLSKDQWEEMMTLIGKLQRFDSELYAAFFREEMTKPRKYKALSNVGDGLIEYRGGTSRHGTIRLYYFVWNGAIYILGAELKKGFKTMIQRMKKIMKSYLEELKNEKKAR